MLRKGQHRHCLHLIWHHRASVNLSSIAPMFGPADPPPKNKSLNTTQTAIKARNSIALLHQKLFDLFGKKFTFHGHQFSAIPPVTELWPTTCTALPG